jgi:hypothetical protein
MLQMCNTRIATGCAASKFSKPLDLGRDYESRSGPVFSSLVRIHITITSASSI